MTFNGWPATKVLIKEFQEEKRGGGHQSKIKWGNNCGRKNQFEYLRQCCVTSYEDKGMTLNQPPPIRLCSLRLGRMHCEPNISWHTRTLIGLLIHGAVQKNCQKKTQNLNKTDTMQNVTRYTNIKQVFGVECVCVHYTRFCHLCENDLMW